MLDIDYDVRNMAAVAHYILKYFNHFRFATFLTL